MAISNPTCHAHAAKLRAIVALASPIGGILVIGWSLIDKGYSIFDYPMLLAEGELGYFRQGLMWSALLFWCAAFWPSALEIISGERCVILSDKEYFYLSRNRKLLISRVIKIELRKTFFRKDIVFTDDSGNINTQTIMFINKRFSTVLNSLLLINAENSGSATPD